MHCVGNTLADMNPYNDGSTARSGWVHVDVVAPVA